MRHCDGKLTEEIADMLAIFITNGYNKDIHSVARQFLRQCFSNSVRAPGYN